MKNGGVWRHLAGSLLGTRQIYLCGAVRIDHIVPISKGGTYDYDNLQCCYFKCNQLKSNEMSDDFYGKMFIALLNHAKQQNNKKMKKSLKKAEKAFLEKPKKKSKKS